MDTKTYEYKKIMDCLYAIKDNLYAIECEFMKDKIYKPYVLEKLKPIENDLKVIKSIMEE